MSEIRIPTDWESWPETRGLTQMGRGLTPAAASLLVVRLFRELALLVPATRRLGVIPKEMVSTVLRDLQVEHGEILTDGSVPLLVRTESGDLCCHRFTATNAHLDPGFRPMHIKGAQVSRHRRDLRVFAGQVVAQSLFIPPEWMADESGPWDAEHIRRVMMVIRSLDNALGLPPRQPTEAAYTETLLKEASRLLRRESWEAISLVAEALIGVTHPSLPKTTERLLERWDEVRRIPEVLSAASRASQ